MFIMYVFWQIFSNQGNRSVKQTIYIYHLSTDPSYRIRSDNGILRVFLVTTSVPRVYGMTYRASRIENTDGMNVF
jgi:hypothetical protein